MSDQEVKILVDCRKEDVVTALLTELKLPFEVMKLDSGDIVIGDVLIERKEMKDFINSLTKGRLFDQLFTMKSTGCKCILAVIGDIPKFDWFTKKVISPEKYAYYVKALEGIQLVSFLSFGIYMVTFKTYSEFGEFIKRVYDRTTGESLKPVAKKSTDLKTIKSDILTCIPGIGRKMGNEIALNLSIAELCKMSPEEIGNLTVCGRRLGDIRGKNVSDVLNK